MRAAVPSVYLAPSTSVAMPIATNSAPAQKSFGLRIDRMRSSARGFWLSSSRRRGARSIASRHCRLRQPPGCAARSTCRRCDRVERAHSVDRRSAEFGEEPEKRAGSREPALRMRGARARSDAVLRAQVLEVLVEPLRLHALLQLWLHFV